ncbi:TPA: hypothetical protein ACWV5T_003212 [Salmonella enterica subsp. enterica serovar Muenchen]
MLYRTTYKHYKPNQATIKQISGGMVEITIPCTPPERNGEAPTLHHQNVYAGHQQQAHVWEYDHNDHTLPDRTWQGSPEAQK